MYAEQESNLYISTCSWLLTAKICLIGWYTFDVTSAVKRWIGMKKYSTEMSKQIMIEKGTDCRKSLGKDMWTIISIC